MHAKTRARVDFTDAATRVPVGFRNVLGQEIDAADVEIDGTNSAYRHFAIVGMHDVGHVDRRAACRKIRRRSQVNDLTLRRNRVLVVAEFRQQALGLVIELETRQHLLMTNAAARILVDDLRRVARSYSCHRR